MNERSRAARSCLGGIRKCALITYPRTVCKQPLYAKLRERKKSEKRERLVLAAGSRNLLMTRLVFAGRLLKLTERKNG